MSNTSLLSVLPVALADLGSATKNSKNPHFRSNYADLASTIAALEPLKGHGVWFKQKTLDAENGVAVETFYIGCGETISAGVLFVPATKRDAQGYGSALTYARRYGLQTAFGLATEDDDGNAAVASHQGQSAPAKRKPAHSALKTKVREWVHELNACGDDETLSAFMALKPTVETLKEVKEKLPHLWDGEDWPEGLNRPDEFVPLADMVEQLRKSFDKQEY